ncbi:hypothetical protein MHYP_G00016510 [Metynnis hypsauchen]
MGFLSGEITVENKSPYKWTVCDNSQELLLINRYRTSHLVSSGKAVFGYFVPLTWGITFYIYVKYGHCSQKECYTKPDLWYKLNPKDDPHFIIRESGDQIHLDCNINYEEKKSTCPNYGKLEDEEQRRQAQHEHERRIEEQIKKEIKISQANERLKQKLILKSQEFHQQTHMIQQPLDIYTVERYEVAETEKEFIELMFSYEITEIEDSEEPLPDRMKCLQNEIMVDYCKKHNLSSSCMFSFDDAVGYDTLPLSDRLSVLEAVLQVVLEDNEDDCTHKLDRNFLFSVLEQLTDTHPSLAGKLLQNILYTDVQLSMQSKEILCQILFNNMWTPEEITDFMHNITDMDTEQVSSVLHTAQTYKLEYGTVFNALGTSNPLNMLQNHVDNERHCVHHSIVVSMMS